MGNKKEKNKHINNKQTVRSNLKLRKRTVHVLQGNLFKKEFCIPVFNEEVRRSSLQLHEPRLSVFLINVWRSSLIIAFVEFLTNFNVSINQSIYLCRNATDTGPDSKGGCKIMQPPLTKRCP